MRKMAARTKTMVNIYHTVIDPNRETEACWVKLFAFVGACLDSRLGCWITIVALNTGSLVTM